MLDHDFDPRWKKTSLEEWFTPYRPQDYQGLNEEYLTVRPRRAEEDQKSSPRHDDGTIQVGEASCRTVIGR
jgi:hypothetical protein